MKEDDIKIGDQFTFPDDEALITFEAMRQGTFKANAGGEASQPGADHRQH